MAERRSPFTSAFSRLLPGRRRQLATRNSAECPDSSRKTGRAKRGILDPGAQPRTNFLTLDSRAIWLRSTKPGSKGCRHGRGKVKGSQGERRRAREKRKHPPGTLLQSMI